ncbi:MAG: hypothetical protein GY803_04695 [Chloroflexi bacterium]|nr:hypothetical protein [Chloroflexota bacterium]
MTPEQKACRKIDELLWYVETFFTNGLDPEPRARRVFAFHRSEALTAWAQELDTLRGRLRQMPPLVNDKLWGPQVRAITHLEESLAQDRPRALIQMATRSDKTYTAVPSPVNLSHSLRRMILQNRPTETTMKRKKSVQLTNLQIGDVVKVRKGFKDPITKVDMGDWHGRILKFYPQEGTALIAFDSQAMQDMPSKYVERCEVEGYEWHEYGYDLTDLIKTDPRDTEADTDETFAQLENKRIYSYLGEEGQEIRRIMQTIDPKGDMGEMEVWWEHLEQELKFPFEAVVDEWQRGPLRSGDKVRVHAIEDADEHYGIIVKLRKGRKQYHIPLCELAAADDNSPAYDLIGLYRTWFANR